MEIWLKGILTAEDVRLAASSAARVSGIIVSNHGGRQLNSAMATIDALEDCIQAAKDSAGAGQQMQVWIDSGIRSGADIFKAVALGANGVLIGRIPLWALAVGGEAGVDKALSILKKEFTDVMGLAGCRSISEITTDHLARRTGNGFYVKL
jgi:(S)-2-hydroxy-acid oxidase